MGKQRAFYVKDFSEVLDGLNGVFSAVKFYTTVMSTMPAVGPAGEDTSKVKFKKKVKRAVSNWLHRKVKMGEIVKIENTSPVVYRKKGQKNKPATDSKPLVIKKTTTTAPESPQEGLTVLDIGRGMEALVKDLREQKELWMKKYHDQLRKHEALLSEMRDLKTDKENLNRRLDKQNSEILRLSNAAKKTGGISTVQLKDVARFTKNAGQA